MKLKENEVVVFENGTVEGWLEARWSEKAQAFYTITEDRQRLYSTNIQTKTPRGKRKFTPSAKACRVEVFPYRETEKAYVVEDGGNGCVSRSNCRIYDKYIAKSICYVDAEGRIFAPIWA